MIDAIGAEWIKLRSVRAPWICAGAGAVVMAVFCFYYGAIARLNDWSVRPVDHAPVNALALVQYAVVVIAMQVVTVEYATGSMRATLLTVPGRRRLLGAKALLVAAVGFVTGVVLGALGMAVALPASDGRTTLDAGPAAVTLVAMGAYLALIGVLTTGIGAVARSTAGTFGLALLLITVLPWMLLGLGGDTLERVAWCLPQSAGGRFMLGDDVAALVITTGWAMGGHLAGLAVLRTRDA